MGLVTAGSCLFAGLGAIPFDGRTDPTRVAAQIVTGIGFLGAGAILRQGVDIKGLTTAASIWTAAAIGMAVGFGYYVTAIASTALVLLTVFGLGWVEARFFPAKRDRRQNDPHTEAPAT
jgi:putative Mg2+ transporter-C (MgtC) family protein